VVTYPQIDCLRCCTKGGRGPGQLWVHIPQQGRQLLCQVGVLMLQGEACAQPCAAM
jgi:hypothetical protein